MDHRALESSYCKIDLVYYRTAAVLSSDHFDGSVSDFHTSLAFQLTRSCSTLAWVSVSWVRDASSGLTVSQLRVSGPVVWRSVAQVLQR